MDLAGWLAAINRQDCKSCKAAYRVSPWDTKKSKGIKAGGPPCSTCRPEVMPENMDVMRAYGKCDDQLIFVPMGGPVAIRLEAMETAIRRCRIQDQDEEDEAFDKLQMLSRKIFELKREKDQD